MTEDKLWNVGGVAPFSRAFAGEFSGPPLVSFLSVHRPIRLFCCAAFSPVAILLKYHLNILLKYGGAHFWSPRGWLLLDLCT